MLFRSDTMFESFSNSVAFGLLVGMLFQTFSMGMIFFGLGKIIGLIEERLPVSNVANTDDSIDTSSTNDILKF